MYISAYVCSRTLPMQLGLVFFVSVSILSEFDSAERTRECPFFLFLHRHHFVPRGGGEINPCGRSRASLGNLRISRLIY